MLLSAAACMLIIAATCDSAKPNPKDLVFYIHITPGVTNTAILNATSGNPRFQPLTAFDLPVTAEPNSTSESLGFLRGLGIVFNGTVDSTPTLEQLLSTLFYDDGDCSGTLALHGLIDSSFSGLPVELAVVGGTGCFRFAKGYATIAFVSAPPVVLQYSVSLR
ncbi:hypothetical protein GOP47_0002919 [Adiantum capillus-veneris]|uniref:Dirigent protein n=1 Tax=Adiantum capillus-veneris TaxID=13818 RepID=A0A9D4VB01_ADICA|nr:hypothetical protein GOP47_0002919 [Adiantum capillus-veneris]